MNIVSHCVTDLRSLRAIIALERERDPLMTHIVLPNTMWIHIASACADQTFYKWERSFTGRIALFIDDVEIWSLAQEREWKGLYVT